MNETTRLRTANEAEALRLWNSLSERNKGHRNGAHGDRRHACGKYRKNGSYRRRRNVRQGRKETEMSTGMNERRGKHFKLFSMMVNGIKYYFIGSINTLGYKWVYSNPKDAVEMFENVERNAEKYGVTE